MLWLNVGTLWTKTLTTREMHKFVALIELKEGILLSVDLSLKRLLQFLYLSSRGQCNYTDVL